MQKYCVLLDYKPLLLFCEFLHPPRGRFCAKFNNAYAGNLVAKKKAQGYSPFVLQEVMEPERVG